MTTWTWWHSETCHGETTSRRAAQRQLAAAMGRRTLRGCAVAHGGDEETYYYPTRAARDADTSGAWADSIYPHCPKEEPAE